MKYILSPGIACLFFMNAIAQDHSSSPVIKEADGYVVIRNASVQPDKTHIYKAVFDATRFAKDSSLIVPALNMAGSELNGLAVSGIPVNHARFVIVFHGLATNGILDNEHYRAKYGIDNPNLPVLAALKKAGVTLLVCGQHLLSEHIDFNSISKDVTVASDALMVLMTYQNMGYALLSF